MAKRKNYTRDSLIENLLDSIPTSDSKFFKITDLMQRLNLVEGSPEYRATRKTITRILSKWVNDYEYEFRKERVGREDYYHWVSKEARDRYFGRYSSGDMAESQAVALYLLDNHISEVLPPKFRRELRSKFHIANSTVADGTGWVDPSEDWKDKIVFEPLGFPLSPLPIDETEYAKVFDALENKQVLQGEYHSVHEEINEKGYSIKGKDAVTITFSPQQVRLQNLQLSVLVLVHSTEDDDCFKSLSLARLDNVRAYTGDEFKYTYQKQTITIERLKLRVETSIKNYFNQVKLGKNQVVTHEKHDYWVVEADVSIPQHFKNSKPDLFYLCNLLSSYSSAVEVLEPKYIRDEMKSRLEKLSQIYS